ncbi:hypothetical protein [Pelotomaculum sp. FP]|uniref:hypothetical protein n=1 Tax=Pelotomaculum sp. FP TaxID=261474 RepID=UPI0010648D66|nr:hypothetical protein [Pelotomaculum sp. FP]
MTTVSADGKSYSYEYYGDGMPKVVNYPQLATFTANGQTYSCDAVTCGFWRSFLLLAATRHMGVFFI